MPPRTFSAAHTAWQRTMIAAALLAVLLSAAFLRFADLGRPSLWYDEILHYERTEAALAEPWQAWLTGLEVDRENGALYYATQALAIHLMPGEVGVRWVPACAGLLTVLALALAGFSATRNWTMALAGSMFLAVSPLHVFYSREGRPYSMVMLGAALLLWVGLQQRRRWASATALFLCIGMAYLGAVAAPVLAAVATLASIEWLARRRSGKLAVASMVGLTFGLWLFPTVERLAGGRTTSRMEITEPLSRLGLERLLASFTVSGVDWGVPTALSLVISGLALVGLWWLVRCHPRSAYWVAGMLVLPVAGWLALLVALDRWYNVRYTSAGLPAFSILVGVGVVALIEWIYRQVAARARADAPWLVPALTVAALAALLLPLWQTARTEPQSKPDWRGVAELVGSLVAPGETVIARGSWSRRCLGHYFDVLDDPITVVSADNDLATAQRLVARSPAAWIITAGWVKTPRFQAWIHSLKPVLFSPLANLEVYYAPGLEAFLAAPERVHEIDSQLAGGSASSSRQEFDDRVLLLGSGWSYPEIGSDGTTFRWATAPRVDVGLIDFSSRDARILRLRLAPFPATGMEPQTVEVELNQKALSSIELAPGWHLYEVTVPPKVWHSGANRIQLGFAWQRSPHDLDPASPDDRRLAAAADFIEVVSGPDAMTTDAAD